MTASRTRRGPGLLALTALALLVTPLVEIAAIIAVGNVIGTWPTLALLVAESAVGAWIVRREGGRAWRALRSALSSGQMPSRELADAALILIGGTLLLTPGFVTDLVGFLVILPLTRPIARRALERAVARRLLADASIPPGWAGAGTPRAGEWSTRGSADARRSDGGRPASDDVIEGEVL